MAKLGDFYYWRKKLLQSHCGKVCSLVARNDLVIDKVYSKMIHSLVIILQHVRDADRKKSASDFELITDQDLLEMNATGRFWLSYPFNKEIPYLQEVGPQILTVQSRRALARNLF